MHNDKRNPGDETSSEKRRKPLTLSKDTLRSLSVRSGVKAGGCAPTKVFTNCVCPESEGPRCNNA